MCGSIKHRMAAFMPQKRLDMSFNCDRLVARQQPFGLPAGVVRLSQLNRGSCQDDRGINAVISPQALILSPTLTG